MPNKTLNIHGTDKEVKFIVVNKEKNEISLYFTDFTFIPIQDVKIKIENE